MKKKRNKENEKRQDEARKHFEAYLCQPFVVKAFINDSEGLES